MRPNAKNRHVLAVGLCAALTTPALAQQLILDSLRVVGRTGIGDSTDEARLGLWGGDLSKDTGIDFIKQGEAKWFLGMIREINQEGVSVFEQGSGTVARLAITPGGNVGIGTNSPGDRLTVTGVVHSTQGGFRFPDGTIQLTASSAPASLWTPLGPDIFYDTGSVAIGDMPMAGSRLFVNGTSDVASEVAVWAEVAPGGPISYALVARAQPSDIAGIFIGRTFVLGDFQVFGSKMFKIDHPLDPANRYLVHSCVESDEAKNVYDGVVRLDADGQAWVSLPDWFGALNTAYRYQLTPIGAPAPDLHVADRITRGAFRIAGGRPGQEVSWQVTGVRRDPWARDHPIEVEPLKAPDERGTYLYPAGYGRPESDSIVNRIDALRR